MKDQTFNLNERKILEAINDFFETRTANNHLIFIDRWMELILGGKPHHRWIKPSDLYTSYQKIDALFECCYQLWQTPKVFATLEASITVDKVFLATEKQALTYFPYQLREKELLNPFCTLNNIFKNNDLSYYQKTLKIWLSEGLNSNYVASNTHHIVPLYGNLKKLISACWLIHERAITKNSCKAPIYHNPLLNFALTEPLLFTENEVSDPFSIIESFFNFTNLSGYRAELQKWYIAAVTEDLVYDNSDDLFFIHNQYAQLIQAGYLITSKELTYVPTNNGKTLGQSLVDVKNNYIALGKLSISDEEPHVLSLAERAAPMIYCKQALELSYIAKLRLGLKEWLDAGLSNNLSIHDLSNNAFVQYLTLQKLTEAFYLIITANAKSQAPLPNFTP